MNANHYFEEIGLWPRGSGSLLLAYGVGLVLSLAFTFAAYVLAMHAAAVSQHLAVAAVIILALAQFASQLIFFLHLGRGAASGERLITLAFTVGVVLILVSGSLWIMLTLNARMMPDTAQMEQYMQNQEGM